MCILNWIKLFTLCLRQMSQSKILGFPSCQIKNLVVGTKFLFVNKNCILQEDWNCLTLGYIPQSGRARGQVLRPSSLVMHFNKITILLKRLLNFLQNVCSISLKECFFANKTHDDSNLVCDFKSKDPQTVTKTNA